MHGRFLCFISYSRGDSSVAHDLQWGLEHYKYPKLLVDSSNMPVDPVYLRPVFLDKNDLPHSTGRFWNDICSALTGSDYLLVLCSRGSARSDYVNDEIAFFLQSGGGRLDRLILVVIDSQVNLSHPASGVDLPPVLVKHWNKLAQRNHIYRIPQKGESRRFANIRTLNQVAAFILKLEWGLLFNRFLVEKRRMFIRLFSACACVLLGLVSSLVWALVSSQRALADEHELLNFERKVFPYSLVVGYVDNFLSPVLRSFEESQQKTLVIVVLPRDFRELDHAAHVETYLRVLQNNGYTTVKTQIKTKMPRAAEVLRVEPTTAPLPPNGRTLYIDFVSTVTAFRHVIDYKKTNKKYGAVTKDAMVAYYSDEFKEDVMRALTTRGLRDLVVVVNSPDQLLRIVGFTSH